MAIYIYIYDANHATVADSAGNHIDIAEVLRIRGWGRISYMAEPEALQDAVGHKIAEILTKHWND